MTDQQRPQELATAAEGRGKGAASQIAWQRLARAFVHPLRIKVMEFLAASEEPRSPSDISRALNVQLGVASYHVKQLEFAGLVRLVSTAQRRGALEHFYELK